MALLQIRDVPDSEHRALKARAAAAGLSLNAYLRELIHREAASPTAAEVLQRAAARAEHASESSLGAVHAGRSER